MYHNLLANHLGLNSQPASLLVGKTYPLLAALPVNVFFKDTILFLEIFDLQFKLLIRQTSQNRQPSYPIRLHPVIVAGGLADVQILIESDEVVG